MAEGEVSYDGEVEEVRVVLNSDSKLQALVAELRKMRDEDESNKALIFSQFNSTLTWLQERLPEEGFGFRTISGSMPLKQRDKAIQAFQKDPPTTVFLLSMRSAFDPFFETSFLCTHKKAASSVSPPLVLRDYVKKESNFFQIGSEATRSIGPPPEPVWLR